MNMPTGNRVGQCPVQQSRVKETLIRYLWFFCALSSVIAIFFILFFLLNDGIPIFEQVGIIPFLTGPQWDPPALDPKYGIWPLIAGTLLVTLGAMVIAYRSVSGAPFTLQNWPRNGSDS